MAVPQGSHRKVVPLSASTACIATLQIGHGFGAEVGGSLLMATQRTAYVELNPQIPQGRPFSSITDIYVSPPVWFGCRS